jgi:hypothetical protein
MPLAMGEKMLRVTGSERDETIRAMRGPRWRARRSLLIAAIFLMAVPAALQAWSVPRESIHGLVRTQQEVLTFETHGTFTDRSGACQYVINQAKRMCYARNYNTILSVKCDCDREDSGTWSCLSSVVCQP